jgi:hypothetical protein
MRSSSKPLRKIVGGVKPGLPALCQVRVVHSPRVFQA